MTKEDIAQGSPWKHCLEITELSAGMVDAATSLVGAKWIWPTVTVSGLVGACLGYASYNAFVNGNIGGGIAAALFACLACLVALLALGCASYTVRLRAEGTTVIFGQTFFWVSKGAKGDKQTLGYLRCWLHSIGSGSTRSHHFHVCLHPLPPLPVVSLFSKEYIPDLTVKAGEMMGIKGHRLSQEDALSLVLNKADEIAAHLDIEHKIGSNHWASKRASKRGRR